MQKIAARRSESVQASIIYEGWVLKKRRKKLQGFARRYFVLYSSGVLSYSFHPGEPVRDQISLARAAVSTAPGRKDILIDSSNATFHIKCLHSQDFHNWVTALRKYRTAEERVLTRRSSVQQSLPRLEQLSRSGVLLDAMGVTIHELEEAFHELSSDDPKKRVPSIKHKNEKDKHKDSGKQIHTKEVFAIFRKVATGSSASDNDNASHSHSSPSYRIKVALDSLKYQHSALSKTMNNVSPVDNASSPALGSIIATRVEEESSLPLHESINSISTPNLGKSSCRASTRTSLSDHTWYDAPEIEDGPQEFLLDATNFEDQNHDSQIHLDGHSQDSVSIADTDLADDMLSSSQDQHLAWISNSSVIVRRTHLPALPPADEGSLFAVLKKNVGKDLSNVALPVTFNEPLTLLQRAAEELEYYELLTLAAKATDPAERMCYVAAFAVSSYAHTRFRSGRKGFNPMLAETFEDVRMKFIAEKVSHNPVILAYHAEGENWELHATSAGKTKFWGKSLEIIPLGVTHLKIGNDHFEWRKPSSFMRNIMVGTKYLEHCGKMTINNVTNKARCVLDFKESGYWASGYVVAGSVYSPSGQVLVSLEGKWDESLCRKFDSSHLQVLWKITPFPKNTMEYYGFTSFGITLNEITKDLEHKLPPTDSRYRPDVRALEEGDLERAEAEKLRIEEAQRERRKQGKDRKPRWFTEVGDEWIYTGGYWESRKKGWNDVQSLW